MMGKLDTLRLLLVAEYDRDDPAAIEALLRMITERIGELTPGSVGHIIAHGRIDQLLTERERALSSTGDK